MYLLGPKKFLARLDVMGVKESASGWKKISNAEYDPTVIVHELTHMLTHDMLNNLPLWMNEGYADYVGHIPIKNGAFLVDRNNIRAGVVNALFRDEENMSIAAKKTGYSGGRGNSDAPAKTTKINPKSLTYKLLSVSKMLNITDDQWNHPAGSVVPVASGSPGTMGIRIGYRGPDPMIQRYRTAHLIFYYFIHIEGEGGVKKIRMALDENRNLWSQYEDYVSAFKAYQTALTQFKRLPGVKELSNGRIEFPGNLTPPKAPELGFDPNTMKYKGIEALLGGESAETVGKRIEEALRKDLGLTIEFETPTFYSEPNINPLRGPHPYPPFGPGQPRGPMPVPIGN